MADMFLLPRKRLNAIQTTAKVSGTISNGMDGFDMLSMGLGMIDPDNPLTALNNKLHQSDIYNGFQMGVSMLSSFSGAASQNMACFIAGTMVLTTAGLVAIERLKAGDVVISTNPDTLETASKTVLETYVRKVDKLVHLTINGEEIVTTDNHPFYVQGRGFINAGSLLVGDKLISVNGEDLFVEKHRVEEFDEPVDVYNFQVEDYHTYFVGDCAVWVHNASSDYNLIEPDKYTELSESEMRIILSDRGLDDTAVQDMIDSFDGPIYSREGNLGEVFTITEASAGDASGIFVTRGSAGATPAERINNLALPPNNTALVESQMQLTQSQILLEGKVAAQPEWALIADDGISRTGGRYGKDNV